MGLKSFYKRQENKILASALLLALLLVVGIRYDYYYDLNDDVTMKDTLAGVYTGEPEGHNIQMLYPLSLAISVGYRIFPEAPVYGMFLCICQYGCIWLIVERSLRFGRNIRQKAGLALAEGLACFALLLPHLVFVQYTFVSAVLAATAAFLFVTSRNGTPGRFFLKNIPAVLLAVLAYMLRTEMLLLLLPLICVAGMYRWSLERQIFTGSNMVKYLAVIGAVLAGMAAAWGINSAAFGSREWKTYVEFFNSRTQLYDYHGIPSYEGNEELYGNLGLTESGRELLLQQYNFGLEDALDAKVLERLSEHQEAEEAARQSFPALLGEKLKWYVYRSVHKEPEGSAVPDDYPWNYCVAIGYIAVFLAMLAGTGGTDRFCGAAEAEKEHKGFPEKTENAEKQKGLRRITGDRGEQDVFSGTMEAPGRRNCFREIAAGAGKLLFLFCVRTGLWMFILVRGREPVRITHSLYLAELCILAAMLYAELAAAGNRRESGKGNHGSRDKISRGIYIAMALLLTGTVFMGGMVAKQCMKETDREYQARAVADTVDGGMKKYCREHPGNFYFFDVYSAVSYPLDPYQSTPYSEKMFVDVDNRLGNYDIMGGWLVKSPAYQKKLKAFGMVSMREALLYQENVYMMAELQKGTEVFASYFREQGAEVELELVDTLCDLIGVYKIREL